MTIEQITRRMMEISYSIVHVRGTRAPVSYTHLTLPTKRTPSANTQAYTEADQKAKRGMKKPTQPTIAHDETHEVGELIGCPLWNCKNTNIPSKTKKLLLLT